MKKVYFFLFAFFAIHYSFGQSTFGVKGGINLANVKDYYGAPESTPRIGYYAGGYSEINLDKKLFIRAELTYSSKGNKYTYATNEKVVNQFNYLSLPVLLGFRATEHLHLFAGPEVGYLLSAKQKFESTRDETYRYKRLDKGINIGLAYHFLKNLGVELRYNYGFKGVEEGSVSTNDNLSTVNRARHLVLQAGLCYSFTK